MDFNETKLPDHPLIRDAFALAEQYHDGQFRKGATEPLLPYIHHPVAVAHKIAEACGDAVKPELIAAALCHDLVEDTAATDDIIRSQLGDAVADYVAEVTDPPDLKGAALRANQIDRAPDMSPGAKALKMSDRIENLYSMAYDAPDEWNFYTRTKYIENSIKLYDAISGTHDGLDHRMERAIQAAQQRLVIDIGREMETRGPESNKWRNEPSFVRRVARAFREGSLSLEQVEPGSKAEIPDQDIRSFDALYAQAEVAQVEIAALAENLAVKLNVEAIDPGVKTRERAIEKLGSRGNDNNPARLNDLARVTLLCDTMDEVRRAERALEAHAQIEYSNDLFLKPTSVNYADLTKLVRTDNGHLAEVKIQLRDMYETGQDQCHDWYKELRSIYVTQGERDLTKDEKKQKKELTNNIRRAYRPIAEKHGLVGDMKATGPVQVTAEPGMTVPAGATLDTRAGMRVTQNVIWLGHIHNKRGGPS